MKDKLRVLFVTSEEVPFAKVGGLADVSRSLPKALSAMGHEVRVVLPYYKSTSRQKLKLVTEAKNVKDSLSGRFSGFNVFSEYSEGVTTYFIDKKIYFKRKHIYGTELGDYPDNALRFGFFSKAVLALIKKLPFTPDIIHTNDWQTALVPYYLKFKFDKGKTFGGIKTLFTIHNMAYQGIFNRRFMKLLGIAPEFFSDQRLEFFGKISFMKSGILYSDAINTVSRSYAREILTYEYGSGLDGLLNKFKHKLFGIPNGVDYGIWDPAMDKLIARNYGPDSIENKKDCKIDLLKEAGLSVSENKPVLGVITRFTYQKGMDILARAIDDIIKLDVAMVILGSGEAYYNRLFRNISARYPDKIYFCQEFNDKLAHKIEAGSDIFLMPSRYEPCGLNQMYSIKYGTVPVVRATGGLDDVVIDFDSDMGKGNGFKFVAAEKDELVSALRRALLVYGNKDLWGKLMRNGMSYDFSWTRSAREYVDLYRRILAEKK